IEKVPADVGAEPFPAGPEAAVGALGIGFVLVIAGSRSGEFENASGGGNSEHCAALKKSAIRVIGVRKTGARAIGVCPMPPVSQTR
ncbi:MAG TPA: hypothetical protein VK149_01325, partial [Sideroxyarcus sp.]|nr:hypothetical protein [Sideroxyarcus sp.]